jgi:hypothetical protein
MCQWGIAARSVKTHGKTYIMTPIDWPIDWEELTKEREEKSPGHPLRWMAKHVTGVCGVGKF